ncbi:MAG TPA: ABC transporter ATP-binding protein [Methylomirabilota bacterium]|nr:ABC transporter ATP-binding protein [Methylomirabilota bacterium]
MSAALLEVDRLDKRFGGVHAVAELSLSVHEGEIVGLIGPNGSGKTTTFHLITGFHRPDGGRVRFAGRDVTGAPPYEVCARGLCRTFQVARPFRELSVLDNVVAATLLRHPAHAAARARAEALVRTVGLEARAGTPAGALTTIDQRRLEVARALGTEPRLILLDETMGGLTPTEVTEAMRLITALRERGLTLLVVEHVMRAIMTLSDRIVVMDQGRWIAEGTPTEIAAHPAVVKAYLGREYRHA